MTVKYYKNNNKFIGFIGLGYWGKNILRNLYELGVLHSACDTDMDVISQKRKKYPDVNFTVSFDEILRHPEIKAVAIATPAVDHYETVRKSLFAGKDTFVEKPLSLTVREGKELMKLAEEKKLILMVGHILQYHPAVIRLKELISSGSLGKIRYIYSNRLNIGKFRTEENILWSFAPHDISVILDILGEEPVKVSAFGEDYLSKGVYDTTLTTMEFRNGIKAHIFVNWLHPYKEQKLIVVASNAMAVFDDMAAEKLSVYPHEIEWKNGKVPVVHKAEFKPIPIGNGEPLKHELMHFIECIQHRKKPKTDCAEGLKVLKVLEAAEEALSGKFPKAKLDISGCFIHESAYIDEDVKIGEGTKVWHFSHILKGSRTGKSCVVGQNVAIGPDVTIGDRCKIQNNVSLYKGVVLEEEVFCGPSCVFTNVYNPRAFIDRKYEFKQTLVKTGASIGANATIVCGVTIGKYAMIGAGAVVKSDVQDYAIVAGVPSRQIGWACRCGTSLRFNHGHAVCGYCSNEYILENGRLADNIASYKLKNC